MSIRTELKTVFDTCVPRDDILKGIVRDEDFAADLAKVLKSETGQYLDYCDPVRFFDNTYPTRGLKSLLKAVCMRLSDKGGEVSSIIRLHTQYGGGKTHGLIALVHAVRGMVGVPNANEFIDKELVPKSGVRIAAIDGENTAPAEGITLEGELRAHSIWGELAYRLAGREGYERLERADRDHIAPGAETIKELLKGGPALILLDEISVYLRKVERAYPGASDQFTAFVHALFKAVSSTPQVALIYTLALGKDLEVKDAYKDEHERALAAMTEAEAVAARSSTQLNPTEEDETVEVLKRRLFKSVDTSASAQAVASYQSVWTANKGSLPSTVFSPELAEQFSRGYPIHPETIELLTEKLSSLSTFQRTRGMLRLLSRTVRALWSSEVKNVYAIHPHHIDLGFAPIRDELLVRLSQGDYTPALKADVEAVSGDELSLAQHLDQHNAWDISMTTFIARTIFLNTLAFADSVKGISPDHLRFCVCSPDIEPSFVEQARVNFVRESVYLDDRPGAPMRFMVEPNLNQMIRKQMIDIDAGDIRSELHERIRKLFSANNSLFCPVLFPAGPYEVPDDIGDGRPLLVIIGYEALALSTEPTSLPNEIEEIYKYKGNDRKLRELRNNLIFIVADEKLRDNMKEKMRRRLALAELKKPERVRSLAEHQQRKVNEEFEKSSLEISQTILYCYRHLFFPSNLPMPGSNDPIAHVVIEAHNVSDSPGNGQVHISRILKEQKKLLDQGDNPDSPAYVRDQTPLKIKGEITTLDLRNEFRRAPKLSMLVSEVPLITCIRDGINNDIFIYREEDQIWGLGDPSPTIKISENVFVHTIADGKQKGLWPRKAPLAIAFTSSRSKVKAGQRVDLTLAIAEGLAPYIVNSSLADLNIGSTNDQILHTTITPDKSIEYSVEVRDTRGQNQKATLNIVVSDTEVHSQDESETESGTTAVTKLRTTMPLEVTAQGPLAQALTELWEKARAGKLRRIQRLIVKLYDASATWKIHKSAIGLKDTTVSCAFEANIQAADIDTFQIVYEGSLSAASGVKSFLEPQLAAAEDHSFEGTYTITFFKGLALTSDDAEKVTKELTKYGAGEAYVEAHAAPPDVE